MNGPDKTAAYSCHGQTCKSGLPLPNTDFRLIVLHILNGTKKQKKDLKDKYGDITDWNTTNVTNMSSNSSTQGLFPETFNKNISGWDTTNVSDMSYMFKNAKKFNQDLSSWKTTNLKFLTGMFENATSFNSKLFVKTNKEEFNDVSYMFSGATSFNPDRHAYDIQTWQTPYCRNYSHMFAGATAFNKSLNGWNANGAEDMSYMFAGATAFNNGILPHGKVSGTMFGTNPLYHLSNMNSMFNGAIQFNGNLSNINTMRVLDMSHLFDGAISFEGSISKWDVGRVTNMSSMFKGAARFQNNISNWNVSNVTNMTSMFEGARLFTGGVDFSWSIYKWNVGRVTNMSYMFAGAEHFKGWWFDSHGYKRYLKDWNIGGLNTPVYEVSVTDVSSENAQSEVILNLYTSQDISTLEDTHVEQINSGKITSGILISPKLPMATSPTIIKIKVDRDYDLNPFTPSLTPFSHYNPLYLGTPTGVTNMSYMFAGATAFNSDISKWDVSKVTDMSYMFENATAFNSNISNWDVSKVTDMSSMFEQAANFNGGNYGPTPYYTLAKWNPDIHLFDNKSSQHAVTAMFTKTNTKAGGFSCRYLPQKWQNNFTLDNLHKQTDCNANSSRT